MLCLAGINKETVELYFSHSFTGFYRLYMIERLLHFVIVCCCNYSLLSLCSVLYNSISAHLNVQLKMR